MQWEEKKGTKIQERNRGAEAGKKIDLQISDEVAHKGKLQINKRLNQRGKPIKGAPTQYIPRVDLPRIPF